ncbi:globin-like [Centruroides sculpturatus]|uniref:globin-like n=1 Tax=Centruroides sculpturatus TaxID=218467 RepID=UPI000C6D6EB7|nr:globin-like [Centruroides sculpturatus]
MGSSWSTLLVSKSDTSADSVDPATGLTKKEKDGIKYTWDIVRKDIPKNGVALFIMFFKTNPDHQKVFTSFADVPLSELPKNKKLMAHASSVLYSISSLVDSLDDVECLKEMVIKIAHNHLRRKVDDKHFSSLGESIISFMEEKLGSKFTSHKEAWQKFYSVVVTIVKEVQEEEHYES